VDSFTATYQPDGMPQQYRARLGYQDGQQLAAGPAGPWQPYELMVNHPLRLSDDRVYLLGTGYAPRFTVRFPDGSTRSQTIQWQPVDENTLLSQGTTKMDQPDTVDQQRRRSQLAITGLLAPTSSGGKLITSVYPALLNPEVAVLIYRGDLGLDEGRGQSIFQIDPRQVRSGALEQVAKSNLFLGQQLTLGDGTTIRFDRVTPWVGLQISHDPAQPYVLVLAVALLLGLGLSLTVTRRRFWARIHPSADRPGHSVLEIGGLARTDHAGYGEEFTRLRRALLPESPHTGGGRHTPHDDDPSPSLVDHDAVPTRRRHVPG
jgi:cytochrome c biogenesis protein